MEFYLFKGLKKPLVFFGLKGKYIYWALVAVVAGFLLIAILSTIIGILGLLLGGGVIGGLLWGIFYIQDKKGLYNKTKNNNELHVFPNLIKNKNIIRKL